MAYLILFNHLQLRKREGESKNFRSPVNQGYIFESCVSLIFFLKNIKKCYKKVFLIKLPHFSQYLTVSNFKGLELLPCYYFYATCFWGKMYKETVRLYIYIHETSHCNLRWFSKYVYKQLVHILEQNIKILHRSYRPTLLHNT